MSYTRPSRELKQILSVLNNLNERRLDTVRDVSICRYLEINGIKQPCTFIDEYSRDWPKHSGIFAYPVPAPNGESPVNFYYKNHKWLGKYGQLRLGLVEYLINKIEEELDHAE